MFLLTNLLGGYDAVIAGGIISFTLINNFNVHIKPLVFKPKNGVIIGGKDRYFWSKSTIGRYIKKYTINCDLKLKPVKNKLSAISVLPTGLGYSIKEIIKNNGISEYNRFIFFSSNDGHWYLFTSSGIIRGLYDGDKSFALPSSMIIDYTDYQAAEIIVDNDYVGIAFSDNIFENKIFVESEQHESFLSVIRKHFTPLMLDQYMLINEAVFTSTPEWERYGTHQFNLCVSRSGVRYKAKTFSFYKLSII